MRRLVVAVLAFGLVASACSSDSGDGGADGKGPDGGTSTTKPVAAEPVGTGACDDIDPTSCLLPWPNDRFTRADPSTRPGRRLDLSIDGMPQNADGVSLAPGQWDRNARCAPGVRPASL